MSMPRLTIYREDGTLTHLCLCIFTHTELFTPGATVEMPGLSLKNLT